MELYNSIIPYLPTSRKSTAILIVQISVPEDKNIRITDWTEYVYFYNFVTNKGYNHAF